MENTPENLAARRKALKYTAITAFFVLVACQWYATQSIAADCQYNPLLGSYLSLGEGSYIYPPWGYYVWSHDEKLAAAIPDILSGWDKMYMFIFMGSMILLYFLQKNMKVGIEHGSASFANAKDIDNSDLGIYQSKNGGNFIYKTVEKQLTKHLKWVRKKKQIKNSGVVVGINPYTHKLMLHDGVEHIMLMAPTRSGKGVSTIVPTGLTWKNSIFFFDPKGELWALTSGYRKYVLGQKVLKFQPLCADGSSARWNPLAEIRYRTNEELSDVSDIVGVMVRPNGKQNGGGDDFWPDSAAALLNGVIMHLLYQHDKENLPLPCPSDIMSFLSSPDKSLEELFKGMRDYPHISVDEFLEAPIKDENGNIQIDEFGQPIRRKNPLKAIYGEYIKDFRPFSEELGIPVSSIDEIRLAVQDKLDRGGKILWDADVDGMPSGKPWHLLLTHPKVAESASNMLNGAEQTRASIMQTAQTSLAIYQNPIVQRNMSVSDFYIQDLLRAGQPISLYLVMESKDIQTVKPIARLFLQLICSRLIRGMEFAKSEPPQAPKKKSFWEKSWEEIQKAMKSFGFVYTSDADMAKKAAKKKKQEAKMTPHEREVKAEHDREDALRAKKGLPAINRGKPRLLLMLDEFPQLGQMECIELALAICAGYGIKICIVAQDVNQLNKAYTKDNSIGSNCHLHIYFTPNIDNGGATAESISKTLGKKTIKTVSHSDGGGGFMKGSDSTSTTGRELMTPDEVSKMSSEKEIVFVAGHKPIFGDKLRYYLQPMFLNRTKINPPAISDYVTQVSTFPEMMEQLQKDNEKLEKSKKETLKAQAARLHMTPEQYVAKQAEEEKAREEAFLERLHPADGKKSPAGKNGEKPAKDRREGPLRNGGRPMESRGKGPSAPAVGGGSSHNPFYGARDKLTREQMGAQKQKQYNIQHPERFQRTPPETIEVDEDVQKLYDDLNREERKKDQEILDKKLPEPKPEAAPEKPKEPEEPETPSRSAPPSAEPKKPAAPLGHAHVPRHAGMHGRGGVLPRKEKPEGTFDMLGGFSMDGTPRGAEPEEPSALSPEEPAPVEPAEPIEPSEPKESSEPTEPEEPSKPDEPVEPAEPDEPDTASSDPEGTGDGWDWKNAFQKNPQTKEG